MNKKDKEKEYIDSMNKYFQFWEKNLSSDFFKRLGVVGVPVAFLFTSGIIKWGELIGKTVIIVGLVVFLLILHTNTLDRRFYHDTYQDYIKSIKENKVMSFKRRERSFCEKHFRYKMRNR